MTHARCGCGAITLRLAEPSKLVAACHCVDCQRRTGAPFGVGVFYPVDAVTVFGIPQEYIRVAASGGKVRSYFCQNCGSTVYWTADNLLSMVAVALGAIEDGPSAVPARSIFEQSKHDWVHIDGRVEHFAQGSAATKN